MACPAVQRLVTDSLASGLGRKLDFQPAQRRCVGFLAARRDGRKVKMGVIIEDFFACGLALGLRTIGLVGRRHLLAISRAIGAAENCNDKGRFF